MAAATGRALRERQGQSANGGEGGLKNMRAGDEDGVGGEPRANAGALEAQLNTARGQLVPWWEALLCKIRTKAFFGTV